MTGRRTVLIVEDDPMICELLCACLDEDRYQILVATCGAEAMEIARSFPRSIDAIVCDILLGEERGQVIAASVRKSSPQATLVLTSGYPLEVLHQEAILLPQDLEDGQTAFVEKPFSPKTIAANIERMLATTSLVALAAQGGCEPMQQRPESESDLRERHLNEDILERYALGILQADLTPAVDEHLLCCRICQLKVTEIDEFVTLFRDAATEILEAPLPEKNRWMKIFALPRLTWAGALAVALIATGSFLVQQQAKQSARRTPAIVPMQSFRGAESGATVAARTPVVLRFDLPARVKPDDCRIELVDLYGNKVVEVRTALITGRLETSAVSLKPGGYWVRLYRRGDGELLGEYSLSAKEN